MKDEPIPKLTASEQAEEKKKQLEEIFKGEDLTGLSMDSRRYRKTNYQDIQDLLDSEFGNKSEPEEEDTFVFGRKREVAETLPEFEPFETEYKMKLKREETDTVSTQDCDMAIEKLPQPRKLDFTNTTGSSYSLIKEPVDLDQVSLKPNSSKSSCPARKKSLHKQAINLGVKNSLRRFGMKGRSSEKTRLDRFLQSVGIIGTARCLFSLATGSSNGSCEELRQLGLEDTLAAIKPSTKVKSSIFQNELCPKQLEELFSKQFTLVSSEDLQNNQNFCVSLNTTKRPPNNCAILFEEGIMINLHLSSPWGRLHQEDYVKLKSLQIFTTSHIECLVRSVKSVIKCSIEEITSGDASVEHLVSLESLMANLLNRVRTLLTNKENLTMYERPSTSPLKDSRERARQCSNPRDTFNASNSAAFTFQPI